MNFHGIKVIVTADKPKMQLAADVLVSPEFRAEVDKWMLDFFGYTNILPDGAMTTVETLGVCYMNPRTYAELCKFVQTTATGVQDHARPQ